MNRTILSWAFYDFANTIFSAVVLTVYFPLYFTKLAGANWALGTATTLSMLLAGAVIPLLGALCDQTGKTKNYLIKATLAAILLLFPLSFFKNPAALFFLFLGACFFYHSALVFYNSLLPVVAEEKKQGFVSGLGTGLGYLGVVAALPIAHAVEKVFGTPLVFSAAALLFLLFSLPLFFFVPERKVPSPTAFRVSLWKSEWQKIIATIRRLPQKMDLLLFLGGNFFVVDALNSTIFWFSVYTREVFGPPQGTLIQLMMALNAAAFLGGILAGFLTDRWGAMKTLLLAAASLALTLAALAMIQSFALFVTVSLTGGAFAIAGIWTSGRKVLIEKVPRENLGEYFGLYGLTTKVSVIGSFIFSVAADLAGFRPALWLLVFPAVAGFILLLISQSLQKKPGTEGPGPF
ncbi:MAG: MFS transporter [Candidatus Omnitrophica bacterium]|nr:MFS transporter [Candidatus Omnitrophota bacterium]